MTSVVDLLSPRAVGVLRTLSGLLFVIRPSGVASTWVGTRSRPAQVLTRSVGARDVVIGAGLAATGGTGWLAASVIADVADGTDAALGHVPPAQQREVMAWAFGFAALGLVAALLDRRP